MRAKQRHDDIEDDRSLWIERRQLCATAPPGEQRGRDQDGEGQEGRADKSERRALPVAGRRRHTD